MKLIILYDVLYTYTDDMAWHVQYMYSYIPGGQKSQSCNQVTVNTDFNYSRTLDQSYL